MTRVLPSRAVEWWASWYQIEVQMPSASVGRRQAPQVLPEFGNGVLEAAVDELTGRTSPREFIVFHKN